MIEIMFELPYQYYFLLAFPIAHHNRDILLSFSCSLKRNEHILFVFGFPETSGEDDLQNDSK